MLESLTLLLFLHLKRDKTWCELANVNRKNLNIKRCTPKVPYLLRHNFRNIAGLWSESWTDPPVRW